MNVENARLWIKVLRRVEAKKKRFDMRHWWSEDECGSVGCGLGWLAHSPEGQAAGWSFRNTGSGNVPVFVVGYTRHGETTRFSEEFLSEYGVERFLDIDVMFARKIIYEQHYPRMFSMILRIFPNR